MEERRSAFTEMHDHILKSQAITEEGPGSILRDFETLLGIIEERGRVRVSSKHHLLPIKLLPELNERMTHPLQVGLQRPVLKSLPNIAGLYLLLRASGLTAIDESGSKPQLFLAPQMLESWRHLNPTERYFNLLETWLLRGRPEIIGEASSGFGTFNLSFRKCTDFLRRVSDGEEQVAGSRLGEGLRYYPGFPELALLWLFGIISLEDRPPEKPGEGWCIERVALQPFGDALWRLLKRDLFGDWDFISRIAEREPMPPGVFRPVLGPYYPEWERDLVLPEELFCEGTFIFRVKLADWSAHIAMPASASLGTLADAILDAVNFDSDHLYAFTYRDRFGAFRHAYHWYMDEGPSARDVQVGELPLREGGGMTFLFDFGDSWEFDLVLERSDPVDPGITDPKLGEEHGEAPEQYPSWS